MRINGNLRFPLERGDVPAFFPMEPRAVWHGKLIASGGSNREDELLARSALENVRMKLCLELPGRCRGRWRTAFTRDRALLTAVSWNSPEVHAKHLRRSSPLNQRSLKRETKACGRHSRRKLHPNSKLHPNMLQYSTIAAYSRPLLMSKLLIYRLDRRSADVSLLLQQACVLLLFLSLES